MSFKNKCQSQIVGITQYAYFSIERKTGFYWLTMYILTRRRCPGLKNKNENAFNSLSRKMFLVHLIPDGPAGWGLA
jgi:hypothetical protein